MSKIPFNNLESFYREHQNEISKIIHKVLKSGLYILGDHVQKFENVFAAYCGAKYAIGVANGTDAIELSLRALKINYGDLVATVSHTAVATAAAIERIGAVPVYVDINPATYTMCPKSLKETFEAAERRRYGACRIQAIIPVHLYGQSAKMTEICSIAKRYDVSVVEDCSQAHGSTFDDKKVGSMGIAGTFSFYPTKNLGAFGDGGAVVTSDPLLYKQIKRLRQYGWSDRRESEMIGVNSRLDEIQAAFLSYRLRYLNSENHRRRQIAKIYYQNLASLPLELPTITKNNFHVYHLFVVRIKERDELIEHLRRNCVAAAIHYKLPVHKQNAYFARALKAPNGLPNTEQICDEIVSLPMYPSLSDANALRVCEAISSFFK